MVGDAGWIEEINNDYPPQLMYEESVDRRQRILTRTYLWNGNTVYLGRGLSQELGVLNCKVGDKFKIAGTTVTVIYMESFGLIPVVRRGRFSGVTIALSKLTRGLQKFNARLIMTLEVWGLAECPPHLMVSWTQVGVIAKIKRLVKK